MKNKTITPLAALLLASFSAAEAQTTIAAWDFDTIGTEAVGYNTPAATTGSGTASVLGMSNSYNNTNSITGADVLATAGASTGSGSYAWRIRGNAAAPNGGNGWSSQAPIGSQGAEFDASTVGFNNIQVSFDVDTTAQAERNLMLEYTINGSTWLDATLASGSSLGTLATGSGANTINGSYVQLGSGWNNQIESAVLPAAVNGDAAFGIRIVNASTGADDVNVSGAALNNTSGNWRVDNVVISGIVATPEPSTLALGGLGAAAIALFRRNQKA